MSLKSIAPLIDTPVRTIGGWLDLGRFPQPDKRVGRAMRWKESTLRKWIEKK